MEEIKLNKRINLFGNILKFGVVASSLWLISMIFKIIVTGQISAEGGLISILLVLINMTLLLRN